MIILFLSLSLLLLNCLASFILFKKWHNMNRKREEEIRTQTNKLSNYIHKDELERLISNEKERAQLIIMNTIKIAQDDINKRAAQMAQVKFEEWKSKEEKTIRKDAIKRSENVTKGKVTEHIVPFMPDFDYNPKDCRFLGSPIDIIVFDGLTEGEVKQLVFIEVKTGKSASLSTRERKVRDAIVGKKVEWRQLKIK